MSKSLTDTEIKNLWNQFRDIPINNKDEIEKDFHNWKCGTDRFVIWHWFDDNYSKGLHILMFGEVGERIK